MRTFSCETTCQQRKIFNGNEHDEATKEKYSNKLSTQYIITYSKQDPCSIHGHIYENERTWFPSQVLHSKIKWLERTLLSQDAMANTESDSFRLCLFGGEGRKQK